MDRNQCFAGQYAPADAKAVLEVQAWPRVGGWLVNKIVLATKGWKTTPDGRLSRARFGD